MKRNSEYHFRERRQKLGLSLTDVAEGIKTNTGHISFMERGVCKISPKFAKSYDKFLKRCENDPIFFEKKVKRLFTYNAKLCSPEQIEEILCERKRLGIDCTEAAKVIYLSRQHLARKEAGKCQMYEVEYKVLKKYYASISKGESEIENG